MPLALAASYTSASGPPSSTPNAMEDTSTWAPDFCMLFIVSSTTAMFIFFTLMKSFTILIFFWLPRSISSSFVCFFARKPSRPPFAMPMTPTVATSPSIRALVAWVVEWATNTTSSGLIPFSFRQFSKDLTTPAATPLGSSWVVLTEDFPIISWVALSIATAFVWVPPTSIPILTDLPILKPPHLKSSNRLIRGSRQVSRQLPSGQQGILPCCSRPSYTPVHIYIRPPYSTNTAAQQIMPTIHPVGMDIFI